MVESLLVGVLAVALTVAGFGWALAHGRALFDRRFRVLGGRADLPLTAGSCAAAVPVRLPLMPDEVPPLVYEVLRRVGARDITAVDGWTVVGWQAMNWRSFGQEVGIATVLTGPGEVTLWCCSRPRLTTTLFDFGASQREARRLADEVGRAGAWPGPPV